MDNRLPNHTRRPQNTKLVQKHNFHKIGDIPIDGKCATCQVEQSQDHIFNNCSHTENLRKHINNCRKDWAKITGNLKDNQEILTYQKVVIEMVRRQNHQISQNKDLLTNYQDLKAFLGKTS